MICGQFAVEIRLKIKFNDRIIIIIKAFGNTEVSSMLIKERCLLPT